MMGQYFYWQQIRRAVTVFGTLFNNLNIVKRDASGNALQTIKVPLSYGPRQKFLSRIKQEFDLNDPKMAIKLPRMAFEITSIEYNSDDALQKRLTRCLPSKDDPNQIPRVFTPVTYNLTFELSIIAKHTDDCLQILEQILPYFKPEYTVTVKEVDDNFLSDMPFVLNSVSMNDDYEGDFTTRRSIVYTLQFTTRVRFYGPINDRDSNIIKQTRANISDTDMPESGSSFQVIATRVNPIDASLEDEFEIDVDFDFNVPNSYKVIFTNLSNDFNVGESVVGTTSGSVGFLKAFDSQNNEAIIAFPDSRFEVSETVVGDSSSNTFEIVSIEEIWNTADD